MYLPIGTISDCLAEYLLHVLLLFEYSTPSFSGYQIAVNSREASRFFFVIYPSQLPSMVHDCCVGFLVCLIEI
jgi:hypothetical protein